MIEEIRRGSAVSAFFDINAPGDMASKVEQAEKAYLNSLVSNNPA